MFLPIGDEPNLRGVSFVTYALLAANAAVFLLISLPLMGQPVDPNDPALPAFLDLLWEQRGRPGRPTAYDLQLLLQRISAYDLFTFKHGFKPAAPSLSDLFFSMFLHGGFLHVAGNMLFLWIYGDNVELQVGRVPYVLIYLVTGVGASVFHMVFRMDSMTPMVGASGAISGILGCYFIWFPNNRVRLLVVLIFFVQVITLPARWVLGFYLIVENLLPFLLAPQTGGGVAYGAHIGGFVAGLIFARTVQRYGQTRVGRGIRNTVGQVEDRLRYRFDRHDDMVAPRWEFERALAAGNFERSLRAYSLMSIAERNLLEPEQVFMLVDWLSDRQRFDVALSMLQRLIAARPDRAALARAHLRGGLVQLHGMGKAAAAREHFLTVLDLSDNSDVRQVAAQGVALIDSEYLRQ